MRLLISYKLVILKGKLYDDVNRAVTATRAAH